MAARAHAHPTSTRPSQVVVNTDPDGTEFRNRLDDLKAFLRANRISPEVGARIQEYFQRTRHVSSTLARRRVLGMLSAELRGEVTVLVMKQWLHHAPSFFGEAVSSRSGCAFLTAMGLELQPALYAPKGPPLSIYIHCVLSSTPPSRVWISRVGDLTGPSALPRDVRWQLRTQGVDTEHSFLCAA